MNISGNYETAQKEIDSVKEILNIEGIEFQKIIKSPNADDGDVLVDLKDNKKILIEVKEENYERFSKYGDLGMDFISVFYFKNNASKWKGSPKPHQLLSEFFNDIDKTKPYKEGKIYYSKSDLWLFFVKVSDEYSYYAFFDGSKMTSKEFKDYLFNNCKFSVNNKPKWQLSHTDSHNSSVFFINHENPFLNNYRVDIKHYVDSL